METIFVGAVDTNMTRAETMVDRARNEWRFNMTYALQDRTWLVQSLDEGWEQLVRPSYLRGGLPTARNIAITAVFEEGL